MSQHWSFLPESRDHLALKSLGNARPYAIEPDPGIAGLSLPAPGPSLTDPFGDLQPSGVNRLPTQSVDLMRPPHQEHRLLDWCESQEKPWDPIQAIQGRNPPPLPRTGARPTYRHAASAFSTTYRRSHAPSECETIGHELLPSDSGYESLRPRQSQSVLGGSIYGDCDRSGEAASVSNGLAGLHFDRPMSSSEALGQAQSARAIDVPVHVENKDLRCPYCHAKVKTKSELKKHKQKHEKPHHCIVPGCLRTEGFSTPNDVDRHVRSCHPELGSKGKYYICTVQHCRSKEKKWPRADNFRQHLKRVHHIHTEQEDIEQYVFKPQQSPGHDLAGLGTSVEDGPLPVNMSPDENVLNTGPWLLQAVQEEGSRDPHAFTDYMSRSMYAHDAVTTQQQLGMIASTTAGTQFSNTRMQMPSAGLEAGPGLSHLEDNSAQHEQDVLTCSSSGEEHDMEFESTYFNEASVSENDSEEEIRSQTQHLTNMASLRRVCDSSRDFEQSQERNSEATRASPGDGVKLQDAIMVDDGDDDDDDGASSSSSSGISNPSEDDDILPASQDTITENAKQPDLASSSPAGSDILNDKDRTTDLLMALEDRGALAGILESLGYQKPQDTDLKIKTKSSVRSDADKNPHICSEPGCGKRFPRACELKKHMKRHVKPYGCTFPRCNKHFGSKNDWKRHENSQHYQLELWKCNEKNIGDLTELCGNTYNRREQFKTHLSKDHGIEDPATVNLKLEDCLDGRNYEVSFWCGFCRKMVKVQEKGLKACMWVGRSNHVDDHFRGQNGPKMDISKWKNPEPGLPEVAFVLIGPEEESRHEPSGSTSDSLGGIESAEQPLKRLASEEMHPPRLSKRPRVSGVWYCCGCHGQYITGFSSVCLTPSCNGHKQCGICKRDRYRPGGS